MLAVERKRRVFFIFFLIVFVFVIEDTPPLACVDTPSLPCSLLRCSYGLLSRGTRGIEHDGWAEYFCLVIAVPLEGALLQRVTWYRNVSVVVTLVYYDGTHS